jgi:DNA-binding winged helix-turn-helix (wHTH) protein
MTPPGTLRFGSFELHATSGELRQNGDLVKLAPQPSKVLALMVARAGEIVTRDQIREHVWAGDTFVDFEQGLNFCVRQIREALGDTAEAPRFIETLPRRGYQFLMPVTKAANGGGPAGVIRLIVLPFRMLRPDADTAFLAFSLPDAAHRIALGPRIARRPIESGRGAIRRRRSAGSEEPWPPTPTST